MADILGDGVGWLTDQLKSSAADIAIYRRGTNATVIYPTRGRSEYATYDDEGNLVTEVTDADFLLGRSELVLGGKITEPASGDRIDIKRGTKTLTYEVLPHGNKKCFSVDASEQLLRIHTKHIKTV